MTEVRTNRIARMAAIAALAMSLTACNSQYQPPADAAQQPVAQQDDDDNELLAAGVGAAAGYLAGRATAPKQPTIVHAPSYGSGRTVVIKQKVIVHKTIVRSPRSSYRPSRSASRSGRR